MTPEHEVARGWMPGSAGYCGACEAGSTAAAAGDGGAEDRTGGVPGWANAMNATPATRSMDTAGTGRQRPSAGRRERAAGPVGGVGDSVREPAGRDDEMPGAGVGAGVAGRSGEVSAGRPVAGVRTPVGRTTVGADLGAGRGLVRGRAPATGSSGSSTSAWIAEDPVPVGIAPSTTGVNGGRSTGSDSSDTGSTGADSSDTGSTGADS